MDITDEPRLNNDVASKASIDMRAATSSSPAVVVTTQEGLDISREIVMRIARVAQADSKRNNNNGTCVIGPDKNSGRWQDQGLKNLWRQLNIKFVDVEGERKKVRWHGQVLRETVKMVTNSENVANAIKAGESAVTCTCRKSRNKSLRRRDCGGGANHFSRNEGDL